MGHGTEGDEGRKQNAMDGKRNGRVGIWEAEREKGMLAVDAPQNPNKQIKGREWDGKRDWKPNGRILLSKGRKVYVACHLHATYAFLPLDGSYCWTVLQGWICRLPGARENITVCGVAPRPGFNPSGLVNNSSLAAGPQFTEMKIL